MYSLGSREPEWNAIGAEAAVSWRSIKARVNDGNCGTGRTDEHVKENKKTVARSPTGIIQFCVQI
jgi:hypothetical protein